METINVFYLEVGIRTKAGNLNAQYSFAIKTKEDISENDVWTHYTNIYKGFDVNVNRLNEVNFVEIEKKESDFSESQTAKERELRKENRALTRKIEGLEKEKITHRIKDDIDKYKLPKDIKDSIELTVKALKEANNKYNSVKEEVESYIKDKYKPLASWVKISTDLSYSNLDYEVCLKGKLHEIIRL